MLLMRSSEVVLYAWTVAVIPLWFAIRIFIQTWAVRLWPSDTPLEAFAQAIVFESIEAGILLGGFMFCWRKVLNVRYALFSLLIGVSFGHLLLILLMEQILMGYRIWHRVGSTFAAIIILIGTVIAHRRVIMDARPPPKDGTVRELPSVLFVVAFAFVVFALTVREHAALVLQRLEELGFPSWPVRVGEVNGLALALSGPLLFLGGAIVALRKRICRSTLCWILMSEFGGLSILMLALSPILLGDLLRSGGMYPVAIGTFIAALSLMWSSVMLFVLASNVPNTTSRDLSPRHVFKGEGDFPSALMSLALFALAWGVQEVASAVSFLSLSRFPLSGVVHLLLEEAFRLAPPIVTSIGIWAIWIRKLPNENASIPISMKALIFAPLLIFIFRLLPMQQQNTWLPIWTSFWWVVLSIIVVETGYIVAKDRLMSQNARICENCGYQLTGFASGKCSECGADLDVNSNCM